MFEDLFDYGGKGFGPSRLDYGEIQAYCQLMGVRLQGWEIVTLRAVSVEFVMAYAKKHYTKPGQQNLQNVTTMKDNEGLKSIFTRQGSQRPSVKRPAPPPPKKR